MKLLLVGGTGFIGTALSDRLLELDHDVSVFAMTPPVTPKKRIRFIEGDRTQKAGVAALSRERVDAVIDLVAYEGDHSRSMVEIFGGRIERFVHLGTVASYAGAVADVCRETDTVRHASTGRSYMAGKAMCEEILEAAHDETRFPAVIIRSAPIHGPGDPASRENYFLQRILRGQPIVHPGPCDGRAILVYIYDLVEALVSAVTVPKVEGNAYHICHGDCPTLLAHVEAIAAAVGLVMPEVRETPWIELAKRGFRLAAFPFPFAPKIELDITCARRQLRFNPTDYSIAIGQTVGWLLSSGPFNNAVWPGRGTVQSRFCGTHPALHEELEDALLAGVPTAETVDAPESILEQLCGWQCGERGWALVSGDDSRPRRLEIASAQCGEGVSRTHVVMLPKTVLDRLFTEDRFTVTSSAGEPEYKQPKLVSVIELTASATADRALLYMQGGVHVEQQYGPNDEVAAFSLLSFKEVQGSDLGAPAMTTVSVHDRSDAGLFVQWLLSCHSARSLRVTSVERLGNLFIAQVCRWLPFPVDKTVSIVTGGRASGATCECAIRSSARRECCISVPDYIQESLERLVDESPWAGVWACAPTIARVLVRVGVVGHVTMQISSPDAPLLIVASGVSAWRNQPILPQSVFLVRSDSQYYLVDIFTGRVGQVDKSMATFIEIVRSVDGGEEQTVAVMEAFGIDERRARNVVRRGVEALANYAIEGRPV